MKWIKEHKILAILIAMILALSILIVWSTASAGESTAIGRGLKSVVYTIERPISAAADAIRTAFRGIFEFKNVLAENEQLKEENADLKRQLVDERMSQADLRELRELSKVLDYTYVTENKTLIAANVISMDSTEWFDVFTINVGSNNGVYKNAVVTTAGGLVGTVTEVGPNWARVMSIVDEAENVSFKVYRDMDLLGVLEGDGTGKLAGYMLDNTAVVLEGDVLITTDMGIYPAGIEIGTVTKVEYNGDTQLETVEVEPSVNFKSLRKVAVLL